MSKKKEVVVVLSGGSARGLAHIGALEAINEVFEIKSIIGTSMGAIIGGLFACGIKTKKILELLNDIKPSDFLTMLNLNFRLKSVLDGDKLLKYFDEITQEVTIEKCIIPFAAISFDLNSYRTIIIDKGKLSKAMRASSSLPLIFDPFQYGKYLLIDGFVEYPFPLRFANHYHKDTTVIGASVFPLKPLKPSVINHDLIAECDKKNEKINMIESFMKSSLMTQAYLALGDLIDFKPSIFISLFHDKANFFDFNKYKELYRFGYSKTKTVLQRYDEPAGHKESKFLFKDLNDYWHSLKKKNV